MELERINLRPTSGDVGQSLVRTNPATPVTLDLEDLYCILQIEPNDSLIALELARQLGQRGRTAEQIRILRNVVRIDYRFETVFALAKAEYAGENLAEAFQCLENAVHLSPADAPEMFEFFKLFGNVFVRRGDLDSAEDCYFRAHRVRPDSDILFVNLGTLSVQRADWDGALEHFRHALRLNPKNDKAWVGLALGHRMKGDLELAWGNLEAALEYDPQNEVALTLALDWGAREQREFRVLELIRNYLVAGGWNERFCLAFVSLSHRRGDRVIARLELERLLAVNPGHEGALNLLAEMSACSK